MTNPDSLIKVFLPDGSGVDVDKEANAADLALKISEGLRRNAIAAEINGKIVDLVKIKQ